MPVLRNLSGTDGKDRRCFFPKTIPTAIKRLDKGWAIVMAGDNGSTSTWKDDDGNYRCEAMRYQQVIDSQIFNNTLFGRDNLESWLVNWSKYIK